MSFIIAISLILSLAYIFMNCKFQIILIAPYVRGILKLFSLFLFCGLSRWNIMMLNIMASKNKTSLSRKISHNNFKVKSLFNVKLLNDNRFNNCRFVLSYFGLHLLVNLFYYSSKNVQWVNHLNNVIKIILVGLSKI